MVEVNYLAVVLAGVASMAIGFVWYSWLFAKPWMKEMNYTAESLKKDQANMGKTYTISFVLALLSAYILTHVMTFSHTFYGYAMVSTGVSSAVWMWFGFVMPVQATEVLFGGKTLKLFAINTGYQLASLVGMGIVLGLMM